MSVKLDIDLLHSLLSTSKVDHWELLPLFDGSPHRVLIFSKDYCYGWICACGEHSFDLPHVSDAMNRGYKHLNKVAA